MWSNIGEMLQKVIILKPVTELTQNDLGSRPAQNPSCQMQTAFYFKVNQTFTNTKVFLKLKGFRVMQALWPQNL